MTSAFRCEFVRNLDTSDNAIRGSTEKAVLTYSIHLSELILSRGAPSLNRNETSLLLDDDLIKNYHINRNIQNSARIYASILWKEITLGWWVVPKLQACQPHADITSEVTASACPFPRHNSPCSPI